MSARGYPEYCHDNKNPFKTTCAYRINEIRGDNENIIKLIKNEIFTVEMVFFDGIIRYEGQIMENTMEKTEFNRRRLYYPSEDRTEEWYVKISDRTKESIDIKSLLFTMKCTFEKKYEGSLKAFNNRYQDTIFYYPTHIFFIAQRLDYRDWLIEQLKDYEALEQPKVVQQVLNTVQQPKAKELPTFDSLFAPSDLFQIIDALKSMRIIDKESEAFIFDSGTVFLPLFDCLKSKLKFKKRMYLTDFHRIIHAKFIGLDITYEGLRKQTNDYNMYLSQFKKRIR
jgi:hypothetical protein